MTKKIWWQKTLGGCRRDTLPAIGLLSNIYRARHRSQLLRYLLHPPRHGLSNFVFILESTVHDNNTCVNGVTLVWAWYRSQMLLIKTRHSSYTYQCKRCSYNLFLEIMVHGWLVSMLFFLFYFTIYIQNKCLWFVCIRLIRMYSLYKVLLRFTA